MKTTRRTFWAQLWLALVWLATPLSIHATPDWSMVMGLYADSKAREIGDLVTVVIEESSTVNREAQQASNKSTTGGGSASAGYPQVEVDGANRETPWTTASLPEFSWQFRNGFTGGGQMSSSEDFTSTMSARVMDVLPNGNLLLEGKRMVHLQDEQIEIILTGMVRPRDISSANTVPSSRLADASIRYISNGPISREQRRGMLTRLVNWLNIF
jgi:flagellar L-ring protein FlgH